MHRLMVKCRPRNAMWLSCSSAAVQYTVVHQDADVAGPPLLLQFLLLLQ